MFALNGLSSLSDGLGVHVSTFQTAAPSYVRLNDVIAIGEGTVDGERPPGHAVLRKRGRGAAS